MEVLQRGHVACCQVRFVLPLCRMLKVFTFFIPRTRRQAGLFWPKRMLGQMPLQCIWAWPNRFLLILGDFTWNGLKGLQHMLPLLLSAACCRFSVRSLWTGWSQVVGYVKIALYPYNKMLYRCQMDYKWKRKVAQVKGEGRVGLWVSSKSTEYLQKLWPHNSNRMDKV